MAKGHLDKVVTHLRGLFRPCPDKEPTDGQLLERFVSAAEEASFTALLQRHGAMVLSVCRRVLRDEHDAEDAFQATFLVLARKAGSIRKQGSVASWLYGVAYRIAIKARVDAARRRLHEREQVPMAPADPISEVVVRELRSVLDEEVNRLPEKYRHPIVLCYLENKTNGEAAQQLGWTKGTVSGRLARARDLLRARLARRGLALSGGVLAAALAQEAAAAVPLALGVSTVKAATLVVAGQTAAAGAISAPVAALVEGVLKGMWLTKVKITATVLLAVAILSAGAALLAQQVLASKPAAARNKAADKTKQPLNGDLAKLQGTWVVVRLEKDGDRVPAKWTFLVSQFKMVVKGNQMILFPGADRLIATIKLDSSRFPKCIDLTPTHGPARGKVLPGIYDLEGERLKLCMPEEPGATRPAAFATKPKSDLLSLVLKRRGSGKKIVHPNNAEKDRDKLTIEVQRLREELAQTRKELAVTRRLAQAQRDAAVLAEAKARQLAEQARAEALAQKKEAERQRLLAEKNLERAKKAADEQAKALLEEERAKAARAAQEAKDQAEKAENARRQAEEAERKARKEKERKEDKKKKH